MPQHISANVMDWKSWQGESSRHPHFKDCFGVILRLKESYSQKDWTTGHKWNTMSSDIHTALFHLSDRSDLPSRYSATDLTPTSRTKLVCRIIKLQNMAVFLYPIAPQLINTRLFLIQMSNFKTRKWRQRKTSPSHMHLSLSTRSCAWQTSCGKFHDKISSLSPDQ